jgi:hypothetical protein
MFRKGLFCCVILMISGLCLASPYTLYNRSPAVTTATAANKVELITAAVTTNADLLSFQFKWYYGAVPTTATDANQKALTICCVTALKASTDPLAAFLKDKCFAVTLNAVAAGAITNTNGKATLAQGIKKDTNFHVGGFMTATGIDGDQVSIATNDVSSVAVNLNQGELASMGFLTTAPTTMTYTCGHADFHATANALTQPSITIPTTQTGTFDLVGSGTSTCTTTTSKSSATFLGIAPLALFASVLSFLALF